MAVVYRPVFVGLKSKWYAWVTTDNANHKPLWARRLAWWPITEAQAMEWYERI